MPGSRYIFTRFSSEFCEAIEFLYQGSVNPFHIQSGIMIVSVTSSSIITLLLSLFLPILSALVLSITIGLMSWLILLNKILAKYHKQLVQIERATPYVLEELVTLFIITGSVFESIEYVSKGEHGAISSAFTKMIEPLNFGVPPEQLLRQYAITQPSITLRRGLLTFIQFVESSVANLEAVISDAHENLQRKYERRTLQWESRMMIIVGVLVFLPIIFILGIAIRGLANQPLILVLPIVQFILSKIMISALLPKEMILLGE